MAFKCLIFDWDGTLIDSATHIVDCLRRASEDVGLPMLEDEQMRHVIGLSLPIAMAHLYPDVDEPTLQRYSQAYHEQFLYKNPLKAGLFSGVAEMLQVFSQQGFYLAIATGKSRLGLDRDLAEFQLGQHFHCTKTADETCSKPDPLMLREILQEMDIDVSEAVMIGDTTYDIDMANRINMFSIALTQGVHRLEAIKLSQPGVILQSIRELPHWLSQNIK